jgi:hypothetical protein
VQHLLSSHRLSPWLRQNLPRYLRLFYKALFVFVKLLVRESVEKVHCCSPLLQITVGNADSWHNMWYGVQLTDMFFNTLSCAAAGVYQEGAAALAQA